MLKEFALNKTTLNISVTGANGYIGSHVIKQLLNDNYKVSAFDLNGENVDGRSDFYTLDFLKNPSDTMLFNKMKSPDILIHFAWRNGFNHNSETHLEDLPKHYAFIKNMIDAGCSNISIMGTMHEVGYFEGEINEQTPCNPLSLYGVAKNALRQAVLNYAEGKNVSLKWLRAFYITGDDEKNKSVFSMILRLEKEGKTTFPFTEGKNKYDFLNIDDLAKQISVASIQNKINGIINVCSGKAVSLKEKTENFLIKNNLKIRPEYGAFPSRKYDSPCVYGNTTKITEIMKSAEKK